jgi:Tol biopolymer transport system component
MDMVWSPDGSRLALALDPNWPRRVILVPATGSQQSFDALSQERLAGFSAEGNLIYLLIPGTRGDGSLVMSFDFQAQTYQELFYLDHRSAKGPKPVVSADGNWLAYLGTPQGSIFIQPLDGGKATQVVDAPGRFNAPSAITKLIWTNTHQLAFDFYPAPQSPQSTWLLDPLSCALQQLPLEGSLLALRID